MSDSKNISEKDLKKLEDEAYFELVQIIAEAMQLEDINILNTRIDEWKRKYKKLLDRPSTSSRSDFKKRIEYLLSQSYLQGIADYILNRLKLKEQKKVEKQAKAIRELYRIIKDTNDYDLLKKKVKKWEEKYPVDGFLRMYQKRIEFYTRDKTIRENSFKQEEAFSDLVDITKKYATLDELNVMIDEWEKKYSINDKYSIDDFLNYQREVERFTSDEFLQSIAREDRILDNAEKSEIDVASEYNNKSFSDLSVQASSYAALLAISKSPNSINEMFRWVYKNRHIKFNDKYKELILSSTYLDYSPTYLNKLSKPDMDMSKSSLSFNEYKHINDIKRYAIISYFNLLLPPEKAISNDYFTKNVQIVYAKSEKARTTSKMDEDVSSLQVDEMLDSGIEVSLNNPNDDKLENTEIIKDVKNDIIIETPEVIVDTEELEKDDIIQITPDKITVEDNIPDVTVQDKESKSEPIIDSSEAEHVLDSNIEDVEDIKKSNNVKEPTNVNVETIENFLTVENSSSINVETSKPEIEETEFISEPSEESINTQVNYSNDIQDNKIIGFDSEEVPTSDTALETEVSYSSLSIEPEEIKEDLDYSTVVALSPLFIVAVNNLDKQASIVDRIDSDTTEHVNEQKKQEVEISEISKANLYEQSGF